MSHQFDCLVDTTEMAKEVSSVKHHVDATTTAVVAMQAAVIKAQKDGANRVCQRVNQGFYALIHSQISQKMANLQSKVDAQLLRLNQQRKQLTAIRQRMERDYQMICARYGKLFGALNRNLRQRITELDRPVLQLATTEADKVTNRSNQLVATVPIGQSESIKTSQSVTASNLKYRAARAISAINEFIADSNQLKSITDRILLKRSCVKPEDILMVPVAIEESCFDANGTTQTQIYVSEIGLNPLARNAIQSQLSSICREGKLNWKATSATNQEVANNYRQMVSRSTLSDRKKQIMLDLFGKSGYETL